MTDEIAFMDEDLPKELHLRWENGQPEYIVPFQDLSLQDVLGGLVTLVALVRNMTGGSHEDVIQFLDGVQHEDGSGYYAAMKPDPSASPLSGDQTVQ